MPKIHTSLLHIDKDRGLVHYGKRGQHVTCHLSCAYVEFLNAQASVLTMINRIYWADDLCNSLPVDLVWDGSTWYSDVRMSLGKRIKVEKTILAVRREALQEKFGSVTV